MRKIATAAFAVAVLAAGCSQATGDTSAPVEPPTSIAEVVTATTIPAPTTTTTTTTSTVPETTTTVVGTTTTTAPWPDDIPSDMLDGMYVEVIRGLVEPIWSGFSFISDEEIVEFGHTVCDVMTEARRNGDSASTTMLMMSMITMDAFPNDDGTGSMIVGSALGAAPIVYCPENEAYSTEMIEFGLGF